MASDDIPKIATEWCRRSSPPYQLTNAQTQMARRKRGQSIYQRDRQIEPYDVRKGEWV